MRLSKKNSNVFKQYIIAQVVSVLILIVIKYAYLRYKEKRDV